MSNKERSSGQPELSNFRFCKIGECVFLFAVPDSAWKTLPTNALRQFELPLGERLFILQQFTSEGDAGLLETGGEDDLLAFLFNNGLTGTTFPELLGKLYGTFAPMFGLMADPRFRQCTLALFQDSRLHHVSGKLDVLAEHGTAVLTYPSRVRIGVGDLWISIGEAEIRSGTVLGAVTSLARADRRTKFAAINTNGLLSSKCMLIGAERITAVDTMVHEHADLAALCGANLNRNSDILSLLRQASPVLSTRLSAELSRSRKSALLDLPHHSISFSLALAINLDHGLFVDGWFFDPDEQISEVVVIDHTLDDPMLTRQWMTFSGRAEYGGQLVPVKRFVGFLKRRGGGEIACGFVLARVTLTNGESHIVLGESPPSDLASQRNAILDAAVGHAVTDEVMLTVFEPAVQRIQDRINARQNVQRVQQYGRQSSRLVSIITPLYREVKFIRSQLMAFAVDHFVQSCCEIIYVVDDPLIASQVARLLHGSEYAFPLDIKLVVLDRNGGFAQANNHGVKEANGDAVILMNSDVIPCQAGWAEIAVEKLSTLPPYSVLGPKLLYADESLQHAGMYFYKLTSGHWQNFHFWKGYGRSFAPATVERAVPAVTGACMIMRKRDFLAVGGFTVDYVIGDYEDSDLCLKLRGKGGVAWYVPSIELFHFERQSMPKDEDQRDRGATVYNRALHTMRWDKEITRLMNVPEAQLRV